MPLENAQPGDPEKGSSSIEEQTLLMSEGT
jgi:hypothetical protein